MKRACAMLCIGSLAASLSAAAFKRNSKSPRIFRGFPGSSRQRSSASYKNPSRTFTGTLAAPRRASTSPWIWISSPHHFGSRKGHAVRGCTRGTEEPQEAWRGHRRNARAHIAAGRLLCLPAACGKRECLPGHSILNAVSGEQSHPKTRSVSRGWSPRDRCLFCGCQMVRQLILFLVLLLISRRIVVGLGGSRCRRRCRCTSPVVRDRSHIARWLLIWRDVSIFRNRRSRGMADGRI